MKLTVVDVNKVTKNLYRRYIPVIFLIFVVVVAICEPVLGDDKLPTIEELKKRSFLDDYYSNVLFGYDIVANTRKYASRHVGNKLNCTNCHLQAGSVEEAIPLNVAGAYPKWRDKNGCRNGIGLRIRECFVYS